MTPYLSPLLPVLALSLVVGACTTTQAVITNEELQEDFNHPGALNPAVVDGGVPTVVVGEPFHGVSAEASLAPVKPPASVAARRLTVADDGDTGARLVIMFHPARPMTGPEICGPVARISPLATSDDGKVFSLQVALCRGDTKLSSAMSHGPHPAGVTDPAYADMVQQTLGVILPMSVPLDLPFL